MEKTFIKPKNKKLSPLLKYPGGKDKELGYILPNIPTDAKNYFEPFVGGGAVYFAIDADKYYINDKSSELMELYRLIQEQNTEFFDKIEQLNHNWQIIENVVNQHSKEIRNIYISYKKDLDKQKIYDEIVSFVLHNTVEFNGLLSPNFNIGIQNFINELIKSFKNKIIRIVELEKEKGSLSDSDFLSNIECAFKAAFYMHFRHLYNYADDYKLSRPFYIAIYFYIREFCYSSMFRYNEKGQFNVPYGGISYNKKSLLKKLEYFKEQELVNHLADTKISSNDFEDILKNNKPDFNDFMFLDPPYDTEFSTYAKNKFDKNDQVRLSNYLINDCNCYFMLVIKNTDFILNLYKEGAVCKNGRTIKIKKFDKKYLVSFRNRNNKDVEHLIITNY